MWLPYFSKRLRLFLLLAALLLIFFVVVDVTGLGRESLAVWVPLSEDSDVARADFLKEYGWEISTVPLEVQDVTIPHTFNAVYLRYNDLQQSQGFDLKPFRGKTVKRYTYSVLNYSPEVQGVRATLLCYEGKVIGGDIATVALDGFMHGFERQDHGQTKQAFMGAIDS